MMGFKEDHIENIVELIGKHLSGELTPEERDSLDEWLALSPANRKLFEDLDNPSYRQIHLNEMAGYTAADDALRKFLQKYSSKASETVPAAPVLKIHQNQSRRLIAAAAAILFIIAAGILFYTSRRAIVNRNAEIVNQTDIAPGTNRATLRLGDGETMQLSDAKTGVIIDEDNLAYNDGSAVQDRDFAADKSTITITTPRGGTYQVTLPDGTKAWLNAASTLVYTSPGTSSGAVRKVELIGEAYFEVFKNKNQPFVVNSKKMELTVLGTHFNINAYADEASTRATLLEGSVRVTSLVGSPVPGLIHDHSGSGTGNTTRQGAEVVTLVPLQQASVTSKEDIAVKTVDVNSVIDWKNGKFVFNDEPLESIMRKVARWYDVSVEYQGINPKETFGGSISRFEHVSKVLEKLQLTGGVHFKIEPHKIIVTR